MNDLERIYFVSTQRVCVCVCVRLPEFRLSIYLIIVQWFSLIKDIQDLLY